jgi:hypothetical protein
MLLSVESGPGGIQPSPRRCRLLHTVVVDVNVELFATCSGFVDPVMTLLVSLVKHIFHDGCCVCHLPSPSAVVICRWEEVAHVHFEGSIGQSAIFRDQESFTEQEFPLDP